MILQGILVCRACCALTDIARFPFEEPIFKERKQITYNFELCSKNLYSCYTNYLQS